MKTKNIIDLAVENIRLLDDEAYQNAFIKSGFDEFDAKWGGFFADEFVVVGGRPGMGKTQFLINLSLNMSVSVPVLYCTLDLSEFLLTSRFISSVTQIPTTDILQRKLDWEQKNRLSKVGNAFKTRNLFIHDCGDNHIETLLTHCQNHIREDGVQVIIVDYLQLLNSKHRYSQRDLEMSHVCRELKSICKENKVCVIVSSQLNRSLEHRSGFHKRPELYDLRDSGTIEQYADKVLFIYRPEYYGYVANIEDESYVNMAEIIVAKNRNGHLGEFQLSRDENFTNFQNYNDKFSFSSDRLNELEDFEEDIPF